VYDPGYYGLYSQPAPFSSDSAALFGAAPGSELPSSDSTVPVGSTSATLIVTVPADAKVWFNDTPTTSSGQFREFDTPPLAPGKRYTYTVRARWKENGHEVTQTQQVQVTAGVHLHVDFPNSPKTTGEALAVPQSR
jgi:uncharacterized protein (TIGR03000 family)